tara:strand:+ start:542 stop:859 length:318 start_codon:yes stop_codon:yes gene_type:complete
MESGKTKLHYEWLKTKYDKSIRYERDYRNGKTRKIRDGGLKDLKFEIEDLEYVAGNDKELFDLIIPVETADHGKSIFWNEFLTVQYFTRDLKEVLERIKNQLNNG